MGFFLLDFETIPVELWCLFQNFFDLYVKNFFHVEFYNISPGSAHLLNAT